MLKILTIIGARPQIIKASALSREFNNYKNIKEVIVHTGQHFSDNMSRVFFKEMKIPSPKYNLNINSLNHGAMTGRMIEEIEKILIIESPKYVLVYGDTNSTLAGSIAAKKLNFELIHVEAGLRSYNMSMPEEINRILTDRISDILFCPTKQAIENLNNEGFSHFKCKIHNVGDVMLDNMLYFEKYAEKKSTILKKLNIKSKNYYLCTIHREENIKNIANMSKIIHGLNELSKKYMIILPGHPRTKKILSRFKMSENIKIIEPVSYLNMIQLIKNARLIITDSGGLQKESYFFNTFCVTLRNETEWVELVDNGYNILVGYDAEKLEKAVKKLENLSFNRTVKLYGSGDSCKKIVKILLGI